jgi:protein kinase-like protein
MAPEQWASARDVGPAADIWAIGVILYELLGGRLPFQHDHLAGLCALVMNARPPKLRSRRKRTLPDGLEAALLRCLEKDPADRYANVGALARALSPFASSLGRASADRIAGVLERAGISAAGRSSAPIDEPTPMVDTPRARFTPTDPLTELPAIEPPPPQPSAPTTPTPRPSDQPVAADLGTAATGRPPSTPEARDPRPMAGWLVAALATVVAAAAIVAWWRKPSLEVEVATTAVAVTTTAPVVQHTAEPATVTTPPPAATPEGAAAEPAPPPVASPSPPPPLPPPPHPATARAAPPQASSSPPHDPFDDFVPLPKSLP